MTETVIPDELNGFFPDEIMVRNNRHQIITDAVDALDDQTAKLLLIDFAAILDVVGNEGLCPWTASEAMRVAQAVRKYSPVSQITTASRVSLHDQLVAESEFRAEIGLLDLARYEA